MITASSLRYGLRAAVDRFDPTRRRCPNCGSADYKALERKWVVTELVRCSACRLMFRLPTDPPQASERFYQHEYRIGFTSLCPTPEALAAFIATGFVGTERDYTRRIAVLRALGVGDGAHVLDYGASWGYGVWQLQASGFQAVGYEINLRALSTRVSAACAFRCIEDLLAPSERVLSSHVVGVPAPRDDRTRPAADAVRGCSLPSRPMALRPGAPTPNGRRT